MLFTIIFYSLFLLVFILVRFKSLENAIYFAFFSLIIIPSFFGFDFGNNIPYLNLQRITIVVLTLSWVLKKLVKREPIFFAYIPISSKLLFLALSLSVLNSQNFGASVSIFILITLEWFFVPIIINDTIKLSHQIEKLLSLLIIAAIIISFVAIVRFFTGVYLFSFFPPVTQDYIDYSFVKLRNDMSREFGVFEHSILFGTYLNLMLPICISFFLFARKIQARFLYGFFTLVILFAIFITFSRSAWIATLICFVGTFLFINKIRPHSQKFNYILIVLFAFSIFIFFNNEILFIISSILNPLLGIGNIVSANHDVSDEMVGSSLSRLLKVELFWEFFKERPLFGNGLNAEFFLYTKNMYGDVFYFLKFLMETGLVGIISLLTSIVWILYKLFKIIKFSIDPENRKLAYAFSFSILGFWIAEQGATFTNLFYFYWLIYGLALSLINKYNITNDKS